MQPKLARQCYEEGFQIRLAQMVKAAIPKRFPTHFASLAGREAEMAAKGWALDRALQGGKLGPLEGVLKAWQAPYGLRDAIRQEEGSFHTGSQAIRKMRAHKLGIGDTAGAVADSHALNVRKQEFRKAMAQRYAQLGTASEPRRKLVEIGMPIAAGGAGVGALGGAGAYVHGRMKEREEQANQWSASKFMDRLKYLVQPKKTVADRLFNH